MLVNKSKGYVPGTTKYSIVTDFEQRDVCQLADYGHGLEVGTSGSIPTRGLKEAHKWAVELVSALESIAESEGIQL